MRTAGSSACSRTCRARSSPTPSRRRPALLGAVGRFLGELDRALEGFAHPAASGRDLLWNPDRALEIIARHRDAIRDPARRALVDGFVDEHARTVAPLTGRLPAQHHPQRRQRLQRPRRGPCAVGPPRVGPARLRRHGRDLDGVRARRRDRLRDLRQGGPARRRLPPRGRLRPDALAVGSGARGAVEPHGDPPLHERLPLRAPPHRRAREPLPDGERGAGLGSPRADARGPSAAGPLSPALRLRPHAVSADARDRGVAPRTPLGDRAGRRRAARPGRRLRSLGRQPPLRDARRDDRHARHDREALRGHARAEHARSGSAGTTRRACST